MIGIKMNIPLDPILAIFEYSDGTLYLSSIQKQALMAGMVAAEKSNILDVEISSRSVF